MNRDIPGWINQGYTILLWECDEQRPVCMAHVVTSIGVGSLGYAVVERAKARQPAVKIVAVEPERAACLYATLEAESQLSSSVIRQS